MKKTKYSIHSDWLRLLECNIPVFSVSVMQEFFSQGPEVIPTTLRQELHRNYQTWNEAKDKYLNSLGASVTRDTEKVRVAALTNTNFELYHEYWIHLILTEILGWPEKMLVEASTLLPRLDASRFPKAQSIKLLTYKGESKLIFMTFDPTAEYLQKSGRVLSAAEELAQFMRDQEDAPRVALMTNGERWTLVTALYENPDSFASWYARDWRSEPLLLNAFSTLLSFRRICSGTVSLMDLLERSVKDQETVTDTLGEQVQRAIEVLIQSLDKADAGSEHALLKNIDEKTLYDASLTVMMRLVFILCAEERHLLPLGDPLYDGNYALSILRERLHNDVDAVLERRYDAWVRFLALCRVIHQGVSHPNLRMPALGGSIFDPDRYPFLEGRSDANAQGRPLPIDNRTFLYLLEALQLVEHSAGAEIVSYGSLDVEQIGHIYEGLLELKVKRAPNVILRLNANKNAPEPEQELTQLEALSLNGQDDLLKYLVEATKITHGKLQKLLEQKPTFEQESQLHGVCGDPDLAKRILPFINLIQLDAWNRPIVYRTGSFMVTTGASRRNTGSYYTPRQLTERVVKTTLEPLVYAGPSEGWEKARWQLKTTAELLKLKICDPTMGSGAFLVQVCRYLSQRLLEAWADAEAHGKAVTVDGDVVDALGNLEPMPAIADARLVEARRLVAERCIYGVDKNPMAVELAKLSIWLVTLAKGRPFAFMDHAFGSGDSLMGLYRHEDLTAIAEASGMFRSLLEDALAEAIELRKKIRFTKIRDIRDVNYQHKELQNAKQKIDFINLMADVLLLSKILNLKSLPFFFDKDVKKSKQASVEQKLAELLPSLPDQTKKSTKLLIAQRDDLWKQIQDDSIDSFTPFHWSLNFPEVAENGGFDAIVGNPPFIGTMLWKSIFGGYSKHIPKYIIGKTHGKVDISLVFQRRSFDLIKANGIYGLISATNISEGVSIDVGLGYICTAGKIFSACKSIKWPGSANINVAIVHVKKGEWHGSLELNGESVTNPISPNLSKDEYLSYSEITNQLDCSSGINGAHLQDLTFTELDSYYSSILSEDSSLIQGLINGQDVNTTSLLDIKQFAIDSRDLSLSAIKSKSNSAYEFLLSRKDIRMESIGDEKTYKGWGARWWQHWNNRADFLNKNSNFGFLFFSKLTKFPVPRRIVNSLGTDGTLMIPLKFEGVHVLCLSSIFRIWCTKFNGAKKGGDAVSIRLSGSAICSLPLPKIQTIPSSDTLAIEFDKFLCEMNGVTPAMNAVCDVQNQEPKVVRARELIRNIDKLVLKAYGWTDLVLQYAFQDEGIGPRYMLTKELREEILNRLLKLNHKYWEEQHQTAERKEPK